VGGDAVDDEAEHAGFRLQLVVTEEARLARGTELAVDAEVGDLALARPSVFLRALALSLHERVEAIAVNAEAGLFRDLEGEVDRETVGVVKQERLVAGKLVGTGGLRLRHSGVEDRRARRQRAQEGLFLGD